MVSAGAAATLVGLLLVAVQIGPPLAGGVAIGRRHAMGPIDLRRLRDPVCPFALPAPSESAHAYPGTGRDRGLSNWDLSDVRTWIPVWRDKLQGRIEFRLWQTAWLMVAPVLVYVYLAIGGIAQLRSSDPTAVDQVATGMFILLFVIGVRDSWSLLVEANAPPASS